MWKKLLHVTLFVVGLLGTAHAIRTLDVLPFWSWVRPKIGHLDRELEHYDTIFLGSSRVQRGVVPEVFDRRMQELGTPARSFNLGMAGLRQHDYDALIDWLLAQKPRALKRVVIELHAWAQGSRDGNWLTDAEIEMHPPAHFVARVRSILQSPHGWLDEAKVFSYLVAHTLANTLRIGQAPRILDDLLARARGDAIAARTPMLEHGFAELSPTTAPAIRVKQHEQWLADPGQATKMLAWKTQTLVPQQLVGGFNHQALRAQVARIRAAGIEPIYVVMPNYSSGFQGRDAVPEVAKEVTVLDLDEPTGNLPLFEFRYWFDSDHFLREGAEVFSRYLADKLVAAK